MAISGLDMCILDGSQTIKHPRAFIDNVQLSPYSVLPLLALL